MRLIEVVYSANMILNFNINYYTAFGESLAICGSAPELGNNNIAHAVPMTHLGDGRWMAEVEFKEVIDSVDYFFVVLSPQGIYRTEWGKPHRFVAPTNADRCVICNSWQDMPSDKPFYSSAFVDGILRRKSPAKKVIPAPGYLTIRVEAPMVRPHQHLAIVGQGDALGNWQPANSIPMSDANFPIWEVNLPLAELQNNAEYKFILVDSATGQVAGWDCGDNRRLSFPQCAEPLTSQYISIDGLRFANPSPNWKGAGTAIPVFSIRTNEDCGIGDFISIKKMVDWCVATGQKILQILPINDTTMTGRWTDSYPYSANSTFALHPIYLNLWEVGKLKDTARYEYHRNIAANLNKHETVDYEAVFAAKMEYLREIFAEQGASTRRRNDYKTFVAKNEYWLRDYAAWCVLRDLYQTPDNNAWGGYARYDSKLIESLHSRHKTPFHFYYFLQYHLDRQLREVRDYAHANEVVLKGDIPIGINRTSVDAWVYPHLFNMNSQAGAPPDDFSVWGQNWGFPTYNWERMAEDGYAWWRNRFQKMAEYFDAYRIDHILGFFRIWEIPVGVENGLLGYFNAALPFSIKEITEEYEFPFDAERHTRPTDDDVDNLLFIEDPYSPQHYHPRIAAFNTMQYRELTEKERHNFDRLYHEFYYCRHNDFWREKALSKLPTLLESTDMLACGEDLGMIPACVPDVMSQLRILSLEIQRMPKDPNTPFGETWKYPYHAVSTTSTHDMPGIRGWWEADAEIRQRFYRDTLKEYGEAPAKAEAWICDKIIDMHLDSPAMLTILPLQDWLSINSELRRSDPTAEQINDPSNPNHYWRYRMHLSVEDLLGETRFNNSLRERIQAAER